MSFSDPHRLLFMGALLMIDGDLNVANEFVYYEMSDMPVTATGYMHNQWAAGSSLIWLPSMMVAHVSVSAIAPLGIPIAADGYSWPYLWAASLTSTVAGLGAVLISYYLARKLFGDFAALLASVVIWLASPLVLYQYHQPLMSHANDACLGALFVLVWWIARRPCTSGRDGCCCSGSLLAWQYGYGHRMQSYSLAVLLDIAIDLALSIHQGVGKAGTRTAFFRRIMPLSIGDAVLFLPLMLVLARNLRGVDREHLSGCGWLRILIGGPATSGQVLLSTNRGLFVWAPVTLLAVIGVKWLFQADRRLTRLLVQHRLVAPIRHQLGLYGMAATRLGPGFWVALTPVFSHWAWQRL